MKIQCDVCSRDKASVFCCADEAALCDACDRRVHRANKLAGKHRRFSISSAEQTQPLCDICKEKRGFVFCQEDRAILCRDCDEPIHSANELTMKHSRFLLTGARLSAAPLSSAGEAEDVIELDRNNSNTNIKTNNQNFNQNIKKTDPNKVTVAAESLVISNPISTPAASNGSNNNSSSSISEYLIKTLPGYRVEDLLFDDAGGSYYKKDEMEPFSGPDLGVSDELPIWVPHVPQAQPVNFISTAANGLIRCNYGFDVKELNQKQLYYDGGEWSDDSFMVPQLSGNKRRRPAALAWDF